MNYETISMEISSNPEYVSIIRLMVSGVANKVGFSIEEIDDIKVAISEALSNAIKHSEDNKVFILFDIFENKLIIKVKDNGIGYNHNLVEKHDLNNPKESGMGIFIIESLMDEVKVYSKDNQGTTIKMTKYLGVDI